MIRGDQMLRYAFESESLFWSLEPWFGLAALLLVLYEGPHFTPRRVESCVPVCMP